MKINIFFNKESFFVIFLTLFSLIINQYYGSRGVYPIDTFTIFDSGFNIISGNHPFKDYWLITGPLLDYFQSIFFLIFGVNWFSYVLHGSIINMTLTLFSYYFFKKIGLNNNYAFVYSLGVAILAYPSAATPFVDHHAVILSVMALYALSIGILRGKNLFWFLTSLFIILSFFSKQIPSSYILILLSILITFYLYFIKDIKNKNILYFFLGFLIPLLLIIGVFIVNKIPFNNFLIQYIFYPLTLGDQRVYGLSLDVKNLISQFKFIYLSLIPLIVSLFVLFSKKKKSLFQKKKIFIGILFISSILLFIYCQLLTKNQILIFFLIPISAALSHSYVQEYFNKKYLIYLILLVFVFSTAKYHVRFNQDKKFMELTNVDFNLAIDAKKIDNQLAGLKWITNNYAEQPQYEIDLIVDTKNILSQIEEKKIIITNYNFFSSILKNQVASPNKWYDHLNVPRKKNKFYEDYKRFFISKIQSNKIKYIYTIGINKENYVKEFFDKDCTKTKRLNDFLIEFEISQCKF